MPPWYPWTWTRTYTFRCQACATMLQWDEGPRFRRAAPWLIGVLLSLPWIRTVQPDWLVIALGASVVTLVYAIYFAVPPTAKVHSDE